MSWNKKRKKNLTKYDSYSIINKLKSEERITNKTLNNINSLSLEELIAIKLELTSRYVCGKFYGLPLWRITRHTVVDALLKTALSIARTKKEGARFLGIDYVEFNRLLKKYQTESFFETGDETVSTEEEKN
tara:strand:- start:188 stop:580 length:393 start_codon:yes stop_codon:yes gene_type:complete